MLLHICLVHLPHLFAVSILSLVHVCIVTAYLLQVSVQILTVKKSKRPL